MPVPLTSGEVALPDGRTLTHRTLGSARGAPVFYLHGVVGTAVDADPEVLRAVEDLDVRYVMVQRPGFGGSTAAPRRTLASFADDLAAVADALRIDRFALLGVSAGGPYALACAHRLGDRVTTTAIVSSLAPVRPVHRTRGFAGRMVKLSRQPRSGPPPGARGASYSAMLADYRLCSRSWGFPLDEVDADVELWHGARDELVPVEHALTLAAALPRCRATVDRDAGHFFFRRRSAEILAGLTPGASGRGTRPRRAATGLSVPA